MKTNQKRLFKIIISILIIMITMSSFSLAYDPDDPRYGGDGGDGRRPTATESPIDDPDSFKPGGLDADSLTIAAKAGVIFDAIMIIGVITGVITLTVLGIKYMTGSILEKAEYKKTMIPYIIGAVLIVAIPTILKLIASMVINLSNSV